MKKTKFDIINFCGNDECRTMLSGIHYANGYAYSTDSHVLAKVPTAYDEQREGSTYNAFSGQKIELGRYPNCDAAIPQNYTLSRDVNLDDIQTAIDRAKSMESCGTKTRRRKQFWCFVRIAVGESYVYFRHEQLSVFLTALAEFQIHTLYFSSDTPSARAVYAKSEADNNGRRAEFVIMPARVDETSCVDIDGQMYVPDWEIENLKAERDNTEFSVNNAEVLTKSDMSKLNRLKKKLEKIDSILSLVLPSEEVAEATETEEVPVEETEAVETVEDVPEDVTEETTEDTVTESTETATERQTDSETVETSSEQKNVSREEKIEITNVDSLVRIVERLNSLRQDKERELCFLAEIAGGETLLTASNQILDDKPNNDAVREYINGLATNALRMIILDVIGQKYDESIKMALNIGYISSYWKDMDFRIKEGKVEWYKVESSDCEKDIPEEAESTGEEKPEEQPEIPEETGEEKRIRLYSGQKENIRTLEDIEADETGVFALYELSEYGKRAKSRAIGASGKAIVRILRNIEESDRNFVREQGQEQAVKCLKTKYQIREAKQGIVHRYEYKPQQTENRGKSLLRTLGRAFSFIF